MKPFSASFSPVIHHVTVDTLYDSWRLDQFLTQNLSQFSRSRFQQLITKGCVKGKNGVLTACDFRVKAGDHFEVIIPPLEDAHPAPQTIPLSILFEDEDLIVIDKPAGLVVHPAPGHYDGTLVNALLAHCGQSLSGISGIKRPGIVHRLDKGTSGALVVAKNDTTHRHLSEQFQTRSLSRVYWAFVWGVPTPRTGHLEGPIGRHPVHRQKMAVLRKGGRDAKTSYQTLQDYGTFSACLECRLGTGRTHQIRVHLSHINHSVIGDPVYGHTPQKCPESLKSFLKSENWLPQRQALHAKTLRFNHPRLAIPLSFESPLPEDLETLQRILDHEKRKLKNKKDL